MQRSTLVTIAAVAAIVAAFVTGTSVANSRSLAPKAPTIATINIQTIFEQMTERKDKLESLQNEAARLEGEFTAKNRTLANDRDAANKMADGPAKEAAIEAVVDKDVQLNLETKKAKGRLEKAQAATITMIFNKIQAEAKRYATMNGYSMVMAADDWVQISPRATGAEATQVMSMRRFIYDDKSTDITADILKSLNDTYTASKPAAPATPAAGTPATTPAANPR